MSFREDGGRHGEFFEQSLILKSASDAFLILSGHTTGGPSNPTTLSAYNFSFNADKQNTHYTCDGNGNRSQAGLPSRGCQSFCVNGLVNWRVGSDCLPGRPAVLAPRR